MSQDVKRSSRTEKAEREAEAERKSQYSNVVQSIGKRYVHCTLDNFEVSNKDQEAVIQKLRNYSKEMEYNMTYGRGIVLWGPPGTGKDHLLAAMMFEAVRQGFVSDWLSGMNLFADRREKIQRGASEKEITERYAKPTVLVISDPVPPFGNLKEGQAEFLFQLIDKRYRELKPTWVSANFADGKDAKKRTGGQIIDRMRHDSLSLHCNWPSYRKELDA